MFAAELVKQVILPTVWFRGSGGPNGAINCLWGITGGVTLATEDSVFCLLGRLGPGSEVADLFSAALVVDETMASRLARE